MHSIITFIAKYAVLVPLVIAAVVWLRLERRQKLWFVVLALSSALVALALAKLGSNLYYDPRPFVSHHFTPYFAHSNDNGFPSDHTLLGSLVAFVVMCYDRRMGVVAWTAAAAVGVARVIAGVHHLADIAGSMVCGGVAVLICWQLVKAVSKREQNRDAVS